MYIEISEDKIYPLTLFDGWGGQTFLHMWDIISDKEWNAFIEELNRKREEAIQYFGFEKEGEENVD